MRCAEAQFTALQSSDDAALVESAWRVAGGAFFKVNMSRNIVCDVNHAFSFAACGHAFEMIIIVVCFACTAMVFYVLLRSKEMQHEREQAGEGTWMIIQGLFAFTMLMGVFTLRKLFQRWRKASTDVFISEV